MLEVAMRRLFVIVAVPFVLGASGPQRTPVLNEETGQQAAPRAVANDNRTAAGRLVNGILTLRLEAREANWHPEGASGVAIPVYGFAERGQPVKVPGPMIRVPAGTEIRVTVRNALPKAMRLRGLQDRAGAALDSSTVAAGAAQELRFRVETPGTYYYWARTEADPARPTPGRARDATLVGAFIVDPVGTKPPKGERVLLITMWADTLPALGVKSEQADRILRREMVPRDHWFVAAINGLSWPHTERLSYAVGDTVHWRVINAASFPHPMHLHGFYFDLDAHGDAQRDTAYTPEQRRSAVTEWMPVGTTMRMTWVPTRPGNWLFHCHLVTHMTETLRLGSSAQHSRSGHHNHAEDGMAGLVMGIRVPPARREARVGDPGPRRALRVFVTERANVYGDQPGFSYVLQEGPTRPKRDSIRTLSSTIVLRQNEPTEITVINVAKQTTTVHWHGIELESFYDGVGDWSGWKTSLAPAIAPGDSFVVRLTPPRAGTFIYHTHVNEGIQLASGLYGALLVLPETAPVDTTERVILLSIGGPLDDSPGIVNGSSTPTPIELRTGAPHRFRLINISPMETRTVQLTSGDAIQQWRALAKDGADLPPHQATMQPATVVLHAGETYDVEVRRERPDSLTLKVVGAETITNRFAALARAGTSQPVFPRATIQIPVIVR
jgi:FtsP/CotA-like multicopper oxidase with cupredoxin domain